MTAMRNDDWIKLTRGLLEKYAFTFRLLMAAYDVLKDHSIPLSAVSEKAAKEPFASMTHPAIVRLTNALNAEDQKGADQALLDWPVQGPPI
jgi:hypothetical protein